MASSVRPLGPYKEAAPPARLWTRSFTLICFSTLLCYGSQYFITPVLPLYVKEFGASTFMVGLVITAFSVISFLVRPSGWATDGQLEYRRRHADRIADPRRHRANVPRASAVGDLPRECSPRDWMGRNQYRGGHRGGGARPHGRAALKHRHLQRRLDHRPGNSACGGAVALTARPATMDPNS